MKLMIISKMLLKNSEIIPKMSGICRSSVLWCLCLLFLRPVEYEASLTIPASHGFVTHQPIFRAPLPLGAQNRTPPIQLGSGGAEISIVLLDFVLADGQKAVQEVEDFPEDAFKNLNDAFDDAVEHVMFLRVFFSTTTNR
jgi:hypothetical protein